MLLLTISNQIMSRVTCPFPSQNAYSSPVRAILAVISLTAGDIDMNGLFYSDGEDSSSVLPPGRQYQALAFTIWLAAVVIMSVLFNNLLVRTQHLYHPTQ